MVWPLAARDHHRGIREWTVGMFEVLKGEITAVAGVNVEDG
jgi:hypothetical protein